MMQYTAYGLTIRSSDPISGLLECHINSRPDVEIVWGRLPEKLAAASQRECLFPVDSRDQRGRPALTAWRIGRHGHVWFRYADGIEFVVDATATKVWGIWPGSLTMQDAVPNFLGPILGFLLRVRGILCLHAAGVAVWQRGLALAGPQGAGKSTLAAAFTDSGYAALADDVVPIVERAGEFRMQPGYPRLRLWDESVKALYGTRDALPLLAPHWDKRYLDLSGPDHRFHRVAVPLRAIYVLDARSGRPDIPMVAAITPREAFMSLVTNTYANHLLDGAMRRTEFAQLRALVATVPVRRVTPHCDYARLTALRSAILDDFEATLSSASTSSWTGASAR